MPKIFFDVDGVLVRGYHAKAEHRNMWDETLEDDLGIRPHDLAEHFFYKHFIDVLTGKLELYDTLSAVLPTIGFTQDPQIFIDYWLEKDTNVNTALFEYIRQLANISAVQLYIATNQEHMRARYLMEDLDFKKYFKEIFHSAKVGYRKDDPRYFDIVSKAVGVTPEETPIFFDDTQSVVDMARQCGWEAHQFDTNEDLFKSEWVRQALRKPEVA